ncbi:MAG: hypothetical protein AAB596_00645 [Patescibacteria group bacterium]
MCIKQRTLKFEDPLEAVAHIAEKEFIWGGQIVEVSETRITVKTKVLHCLDTSIFEGSIEEMKPLFKFACYMTEIIQRESEIKNFDRFGSVSLYPFPSGSKRVKVFVMLVCGIENMDDIGIGPGNRICDIVAAAQLLKEEQCSFREALAL